MKKGGEEKTEVSKILPSNEIINACCTDIDCGFFVNFSVVDLVKAHLISSNAT